MTDLTTLDSIDEVGCIVWDLTRFFPDMDGSVLLKQNILGKLKSNLGPPTDAAAETFVSRSYCADYSIQVSSSRRCGIDMETKSIAQPDWKIDNPLFQAAMLAPGELERIEKSEYWELPNLEQNIWSSKEALAKALGEAKNYQPNKIYSPITWERNPVFGWRATFREFKSESGASLFIWLVVKIEA